ncbi:uncharacterized protein [Oryza sativa Japonica Group]|uniref:Os07g0167500 protein n=2 Tax=Oryza sativa subsp. japonica TaxID=39947 RepID=Q7F1R9_ORYSJ|nr:uncharacterized protein LOC4342493 [Oryza sativa Japonica Group]XP_025882708.1 uncharacterized protein LOC4342493 [Oryza sativa Japonica Group]KAB8104449.1 hypothetical protein EE612_037361 [Oryza sativa]KAF2921590.1 hypothetical protein DAI22_07g045800 [Oryza sativa Japonica Group]BAC83137.1 unknown protein [Oryza sativa Japonica Group]BAF20892.1 Os07g0167500 [Oryza sativa Japonica Group]BAG87810.1 unnamed protein product [Oryza sativa Japonica Group]|eukprot:NP_001058978.1 Os07g0167500 [Oryza sativa Japonica Group]
MLVMMLRKLLLNTFVYPMPVGIWDEQCQLVYKTIMAVLHALNPILRPRTLGHNSGTRRDIFGSSPGGGDAGRHVLFRSEESMAVSCQQNEIRLGHSSSGERVLHPFARGGAGGGAPFAHGEEHIAIDIDLLLQATPNIFSAREASPTPVTPDDRVVVAQTLQTILASILPLCAASRPLFKDGPEYAKVVTFGFLGTIVLVAYAGVFAKAANSKAALRLVVSAAIAAMTFAVASQLSGIGYIVTASLTGAIMAAFIMLAV